MKMSEGVEWSLHCAVLLGSLPPKTALPAKALAEFHGVSESYLLKHLKALAKAGIMESVSGPKGGYRLSRPSTEISVLEVVDAIEGKSPAFRCMEIRAQGPCAAPPEVCRRAPCAINATMLRAERAWRDVLRHQSIADLVSHVGQTVEKDRHTEMTAWLESRSR